MLQSRLETPHYMSKDRDNATGLVTGLRQAMVASHVRFNPNDAQREAKAEFWLAFKANPLVDEEDITPALVSEILGQPIDSWVKIPGFWAYFRAKDTARRYLEIAAERATEMAIMMLDPAFMMNDNARVTLIKTVLEFSGRAPAVKKEVKWADREIGEADEATLDKMLEKAERKALKSRLPKEE